MNANIRPIANLGWIASIDHEQRVIYAIGNTRDECIKRFKRALVFYNDYYYSGEPFGYIMPTNRAEWLKQRYG